MTGQERSFGPEMRRRRVEAGVSLAELAARTHYTKGYLSKIETGHKPPSDYLARRCDSALGASGELAALVRRPAAEAPETEFPEGDTWVLSLTPDGKCRFVTDTYVPPDDSSFWPGTGGGSLVAAARSDRLTSTLAAFQAQFDQARRLGQWAPPAAVLPAVITQTGTLRGLAAAAEEPGRSRLLYLAARCAEFAGWMAQETGNDQAALWWTRQSVLIAPPSEVPGLSAYSLVRRAEIALYHDDANHVIKLTRAARERSGVPARIRGLAAQREAQGHALRGDADECRRSLELAARLLGSSGTTAADEPVIGPSSVANLNTVVSAWCLFELGRPEDAAELLDREVPLISGGALRARLRFGARRALAHAAAGDIDRACALTSEVLDVIDVVDSATIRTDLRRLARTLIRWHGHEPVREIHPRLTAALHTGEV